MRAEREPKVRIFESQLAHALQRAGRVEDLLRRQRKAARVESEAKVEDLRELVERLRAEQTELPETAHQARAEVAVLDHLIAERERAALHAVRISPPDYIVTELGERPSEPDKQRVWDQVVLGIEGYREQHGVADRDNALGRRPKIGLERSQWESQRRELGEDQRRLERSRALEQAHELRLEIGHGIER